MYENELGKISVYSHRTRTPLQSVDCSQANTKCKQRYQYVCCMCKGCVIIRHNL